MMAKERADFYGTLFAAILMMVCVAVGFSLWNGRTAIVVFNETGCSLDVLNVNLPGLDCVFGDVAPRSSVLCAGRSTGDGLIAVSFNGEGCVSRKINTEEYANPIFGWKGVLLLREDGTLGVAQMTR